MARDKGVRTLKGPFQFRWFCDSMKTGDSKVMGRGSPGAFGSKLMFQPRMLRGYKWESDLQSSILLHALPKHRDVHWLNGDREQTQPCTEC